MVLHAAFIEQHVADEQVATVHAAAVFREGRAGDGEVGARIGAARAAATNGGVDALDVIDLHHKAARLLGQRT